MDVNTQSQLRGEISTALQTAKESVLAMQRIHSQRIQLANTFNSSVSFQYTNNNNNNFNDSCAVIDSAMLSMLFSVIFVVNFDVYFTEWRAAHSHSPIRLHVVSGEDAPAPLPMNRLSVDVCVSMSELDSYFAQLSLTIDALLNSADTSAQFSEQSRASSTSRNDRDVFLLPPQHRAEVREVLRENERARSLLAMRTLQSALRSAFVSTKQRASLSKSASTRSLNGTSMKSNASIDNNNSACSTHAKIFYFVSLSDVRELDESWKELYSTSDEVFLYGESISGDLQGCVGDFASKCCKSQPQSKSQTQSESNSCVSMSLSVLAFSPHSPANVTEADLARNPDHFTERPRDRELDIAALSSSAMRSGGRCTVFAQRSSNSVLSVTEKDRVVRQVLQEIESMIGCDAVCTLHLSSNIKVSEAFAGGSIRFDDIRKSFTIPAVDAHTTFVFALEHNKATALKEDDRIVVQFVVMYNSFSSSLLSHCRRARVHTISLQSTTRSATLYKYVDQCALGAALTKIAMKRALHLPLSLRDGDVSIFISIVSIEVY